jgi:recombination protein RecR
VLCIVATEQDLLAVEHTGEFHGLYHVLGGTLSAADGVTPDDLTVRELLERLRQEALREIIFAFDQTIDGETTTLYLIRLLGRSKAKLTRLARGMPLGSEVNYADEHTLSGALRERSEVPNPFAIGEDGGPF